jgi:ech hydrogenase subunit A
MSMKVLLFLLLFPLIPALLSSIISHQLLRGWIIRLSALAIGAASIYLGYLYIGKGTTFFHIEVPYLEQGIFAAEMLVALFLLYRCKAIKTGEWWIPVLIIAQAAVSIYCEFGLKMPHVKNALYIDDFSIIMALIIGIIGSLICVYSVQYMKEYHHHHKEMKDRQKSFFFIMFLFLSAMFGVVFANNLVWLFLCWEITTLCSFVMIAYPKTQEATRNAFRALGLNMLGGVAFVIAIYYLLTIGIDGKKTLALSEVLAGAKVFALVPAVLISFAGITKSAQMPFSSWLLGAMVAPTPVSALLHSSTMVKAGVFIIVKFAPVLQGTIAGYMVALVGGVTFLMTSLLAVTQSNAKRVLAYSTIANLGLVVACAGIGTYETIWAAILLIIFHAVSKGLLFLGVGTIEHKIGSRDIEDMGGLITLRPGLGMIMVIGMLGMFLAPFGMLISKWATLKAFIDANPPILAILVAFGSAPTLFFWTKWMGKIVAVPPNGVRAPDRASTDEWSALGILAVLTVAACGLFPLVGTVSITPYLMAIYHQTVQISSGNLIIMAIMLGLMILLPVIFSLSPRKWPKVPAYLAGANIDGSVSFQGAMGLTQQVGLRNYYLTGFLNENKLTVISIYSTILIICALFATMFKPMVQ